MIHTIHEPSSTDRAASSSLHFTGTGNESAIPDFPVVIRFPSTTMAQGRTFSEALAPHLETLPECDLTYLAERLRDITGRLPLAWLIELHRELHLWHSLRCYQRTGNATPQTTQPYMVADVAR
jgi:hypothetical protein